MTPTNNRLFTAAPITLALLIAFNLVTGRGARMDALGLANMNCDLDFTGDQAAFFAP
jgi:hypothetical protein